MSYYDDCNLPTISTLGGADLLTVFSQENGSKRNISAANARTFMQDGATVANGLLGLSSIYELYQSTATAVYTTGGSGVQVPLVTGLGASRILPAGRTSIAIINATGEFVFQRDCQAVYVGAQVTLPASGAANGPRLHAKIVSGGVTYISHLSNQGFLNNAESLTTARFTGVMCNPNNLNNMIKAGDRLSFYFIPTTNVSSTYTFTNQVFTVQTMDGI